jgi:hypothetical protein
MQPDANRLVVYGRRPRRTFRADDFGCFRDDIKPGLMRRAHTQLAPIDDMRGREVLDPTP